MATTNKNFKVKNGLEVGGNGTFEGTVTADSFNVDVTAAITPDVGQIAWDMDFDTIATKLNEDVTLQIGQEHLVRVKNASGSTPIPDRTVVMFAGATGDTVTVTPAIADGVHSNQLLTGITTQEISADGFGFVTQFGFVNGVDTSAWLLGDFLYVDPLVPGGLTNVKPPAPAWEVPVAAVTKVNASAGRILVRAIPGSKLDEINDVSITSPVNGQVLKYNNGLWINATDQTGSSEGGSITVSETAPASPSEGDQWYKSSTGQVFIYYDNFWVESNVSPSGPTGDPGRFYTSDVAPTNPVDGDAWFDTSTAKLLIYYDGFWVEAAAGLQGPQGIQGPSGTVSVTSPITNTGTATEANIGIDQSQIQINQWQVTGLAIPDAYGFTALQNGSGGLSYQPVSHNYIINGAFDLSQRGGAITGINSDGTYTADRWYLERGGSVNYAQRQIGSYNPPTNFEFYAEIVNQTASNPFQSIGQAIETRNAYQLAGKQVTVTFYARAHADTAASKYLKARLRSTTSADTRNGTVFGVQTYTTNFGTASADWYRYTITATVPSNARTVTVDFVQDTALAVGDGFHITGVQLEVGSMATPFKRHAPSLGLEELACQRFYQRIAPGAYREYMVGYAQTSSTVGFVPKLYTKMRTFPTSIDYNDLYFYDGATYPGFTSLSLSGGENGAFLANFSYGITQFRNYTMYAGTSGNSYLAFSAEIV